MSARVLVGLAATALVALAARASAQWPSRPTSGMPKTGDLVLSMGTDQRATKVP